MKNALGRQAHPAYTFSNYITGNNIAWMQNINWLIETSFAEYDCIIIKSTGGMGGTHILDSFCNSLNEKSHNVSNSRFDSYYWNRTDFSTLFDADYLLIYAFHNFYTEPNLISDFENLSERHFQLGRKLFVKINHQHINPRFYNFFKQFRIHEIYPVAVSEEILLQMAEKLNDELENELTENELKWLCTLKYRSYRVFQNFIFMSWFAKREIKPGEKWEVKIMELYERFV